MYVVVVVATELATNCMGVSLLTYLSLIFDDLESHHDGAFCNFSHCFPLLRVLAAAAAAAAAAAVGEQPVHQRDLQALWCNRRISLYTLMNRGPALVFDRLPAKSTTSCLQRWL